MTLNINIRIETDNAAFEDEPATEVARLVKEVAKRLYNCDYPGGGGEVPLLDINGNTCGYFSVVNGGK